MNSIQNVDTHALRVSAAATRVLYRGSPQDATRANWGGATGPLSALPRADFRPRCEKKTFLKIQLL